jgi:hypothetical protein
MSTTLTRPKARLRRSFAGVVLTALAASSLALLPGTAQAADVPLPAPVASLKWKVSETATTALTSRTFTEGASQDANSVLDFPGGTGYYDSGTGAASISYQGSAALSFVAASVTQYTVTIKEPQVTVTAAGEGTVTATVSGYNFAGTGSEGVTTTPARVTVATFDVDDDDWATTDGLANVTVTPDWLGNVNPGSPEAAALGISGTTLPWSGKSFNYGFMQQVTPGVRARFYASGSTEDTPSNNNKKPSDITFSVALPRTSVATTAASPAGGLNLSVTGSGFTRATNPGDAGVYVGLTSAFAGANWVMPGAIDQATGAFTSTINAPTAALDPTRSYSLYTWRAHTHSTPSQNTETPVAIDFKALGLKVTSAPSVSAPSSTYGTGSTVTVTIPQRGKTVPTGTVTLRGAVAQSSTLSGGTATFQLPRTLPAGSTTVTVAYSGDDSYAASNFNQTFTIAKAAVKVTRNKITKKPTSKRSGKTSLTLRSVAGGPAVSGKVKVTFSKKNQKTRTKTVTVKNGKGTVTIPRLKKGTWKIAVRYEGTANFAKTATKNIGTVKVTK